MRKFFVITALTATVFLSGCTRENDRNQSDSAARQAGRTAYKLDQDSKKAAHELENGLNRAAHDARQGWNDAKHEDRHQDPTRR